MKEMKNIENFNDRDWEELASILSEEKSGQSETLSHFMAQDSYDTGSNWKNLKKMSTDREINVDKAWNKIQTKIREAGIEENPVRNIFQRTIFKIAATLLILTGLGTAVLYLNRAGMMGRKITVSTTYDQKNLKVPLPDGSTVYLNRNTRLTYRSGFGKPARRVSLNGEAYFEITQNPEKPFTIDAGKAKIEVLGTSFNVITENENSDVEVYVTTGKVMLSNDSGARNLVIDPGYIGTISSGKSEKRINNNPNYLSWKTGKLVYDGQKLEVVFKDLKRVYNMDIIADNPAINDIPWTIPIYTQSQDTIIRIICATFNLSYTKDGDVYHLSKK